MSEFTYGGEFKHMPDPASCSDAEWADYVFNSDNLAGVVPAWGPHHASRDWVLAERHTVSDQVLRTFDPKALFDRRVDFTPAASPEITG